MPILETMLQYLAYQQIPMIQKLKYLKILSECFMLM
nr:MAG TPA: hypothetical protein [Caudoviricetes sp.]DAR63383.1 MAG TPA: hypothetical protein [Caudoviricetes sp.]